MSKDNPVYVAGKTAEEWAEQALGEIIDGIDALISLGCVEHALRIDYGEEPDDTEPEPECTCPPDLKVRGGFSSSCPACSHIYPERAAMSTRSVLPDRASRERRP